MPLTIEHHAVMFALLAKHAIEISGEKGKEAILAGMTRYGNERGRRMALNALERAISSPYSTARHTANGSLTFRARWNSA